MNLIIDVGNTRVKAAVFKQDTLVELFILDTSRIVSEIKKIVKKRNITSIIVSSVAKISDYKLKRISILADTLLVSSKTKVPFKNLYKTPQTLGVDRIALASGVIHKYRNKNVLVIDAGTCITFDFVNNKKEYLGGAISPGVEMRYKALHNFTGKLPLIEKKIPDNFIGNSTNESMNSGIVNGVIKEIEGVISQYKEKYTDLTVVLTGGDTNFLAKQLKSSIFANQNFLLEGLNTLLIYNKEE
ncbi:type III pantothenate kinase [Lutibacter sp. Hel_I_33_5]|uniref:type III pantothenate kinase n=1 Tax=Lutibacter sp. Hel_I_33_5 TaxID=1566289 RepID=UPI0011A476FF|nr:type III pantothenate kinase [Lutibacter sp. Hel_I_33_5]TVZ55814.1 type III pantothenate kinase [Lutibacter sp. Hel_I_33_5]